MSSELFNKLTNIYEILDQIRIRSGMYLGKDESLEVLETFIIGYLSCMINNRFNEKHEFLPFQYFQNFVNQKYKGHSGLTWCGIIQLNNNNDDQKSFEVFYELLDEFKQIRPISIRKIILTDTQIQHYSTYLKNENRKVETIPDTIYIMEFSKDFGFDSCFVKDEKVMDWAFSYRYSVWNSETDILEQLKNQFGKIENWEMQQDNLMETIEYLMKIR